MANPYADWGNQQSQKLAAAQHKAPTLNDQQMGGVAPGSVPMGKPAPNFQFKATGKPQTGHSENWQFVNGKQPIKSDVQLPQNAQQNPDWNVYGDSSGNRWWENEQTGQRIPIHANAPVDAPIHTVKPFDRQMTLPIQHLNSALKARATPIKA